ncbi:MAG: hypothetical protein WD851_02840 [Pirellulales bacterium]
MQHVAAGLGAYLGGIIVTQPAPTAPLEHFGTVGWIAAIATLASLWLAGRVRTAEQTPTSAESISLAAAAEAEVDAGEPAAANDHGCSRGSGFPG